jgi:outer membrane protein
MKRLQERLSKTTLLWLLAGCMAISATAQERHDFSIQQAVDYAMKNSVQVKNALLDIKLQEQTNRDITSAAYPHLNGSISGTYNPNIAVQSFPNFIGAATYGVLVQEGVKNGTGQPIVSPADFGFIEAQFGTKYLAGVGLDFSQLLFDGQVFVGLQARRTSIDWSTKNVAVTQEGIKVNIYKIYYQLVVSKTQVELLDANIDRLQKLSHDTKAMYQNGFAEQLDVDKIDVQVTNLITEKTKVLNTVSTGFLGLKLLMGMPMKDTVILTDTISDDQIKEGALEAASYNYTDRVEYQYAELGKKLNEFNIKRYKLSQIPTVNLTGNYSKNAQRNEFNFFSKGDWFTFSSINLRINIPIFNGFSTRAKIDGAKLELQKTDNRIEGLKLSIDNEVQSARLSFSNAVATMNFQRKNMELAERVYDQTRKKYESGLGSNTDITVSQTDLKAAQTNYINALYDAVIARVDYLKAVGKL